MAAIVMTFRGAEYRIPEEKAFAVGEQVEDIVTLPELMSWGAAPKFYKVARCYGVMLRAAGAKVSDAEIHREMMAQIAEIGAAGGGDAEGAKAVLATQAVGSLIAVLMDGVPTGGAMGGGAAPGKPNAS